MKSKRILAVLLTLLTVLTVFSFSAYALNWDGSSAGGSTNAVNGSATGYVIRSTNDSNCVVGYRFSVVNEAGNMKVNKVIDVFRNTGNGDNAYSTSAKFTTKYNKKQLIANKNAKLTTSVNTTNCYKESSMGFVTALPNPSGVETWQAYETNINKVLNKLGVGSVSNMYYGDKVIIEPLFDTCLAGEYQALTVTEIAYCGRSVLGGSSDGGTSKGNSSTWGFIANYTNRIWPNKLYTPNGQGLWTAASAIGSSSKATFDNILTKGYGAGIAYNETTNMLYTIEYNANGGSGSMSSHTTTSSATIKTNAFTKTGYTFSGWIVKRSDNKYYHSSTGWTTSTASAKVYKSGESHNFSSASWRYSSGNSGTLLSGNRTFTFIAQWTPITYTVSYNANGGSGAPSNQTKTYGVNLTLSSTKPTRTGYTFNGWNTNSSGSGTNYASGATYSSNANLTLYAKWTPVTYTVTYNANGGSGAPSAQTKTHGVDLTLSSTKPTRTGYTFNGWNTNSSGTGTNYASGGKYTANANVTLYAKWTPVTYTVTYNANGGSGAPSAQTKTHGVDLTLSSTKPTRTGYTFNGWNTNSSETGTNYASGGKYTANANVTLYAKWTPVTYTVTYNANGGSGAPSAQTKNHGVDLTLSSTKPTRTGYTFNGWNTNSSGSGTNYASGGKYTANANVTLYAKWTPNVLTICYDCYGSSVTIDTSKGYKLGEYNRITSTTKTNKTIAGTPNVFYHTLSYNNAIGGNGLYNFTTFGLTAPTGYTFSCWKNGTKTFDQDVTTYKPTDFTSSIESGDTYVWLTAQFTPNTYTVKYYLDGVEQTSLRQTCTYGTSYKYPSVPTKTGYTITGWWSGSSSSSKGTQYTSGSSFSNLTSTNGGTVNRYAYSTPNTYTVKYYLDGVEQTALKQTCSYGTSYSYQSLPTKTGYTVTGWWSGSSSSSKGTQYTAGSSFSNLTSTNGGTINRYAYSTPNTYTVKYYLDGVEQTSLKQTCTYGTSYSYKSLPTKSGYTVSGWWSGSSASSKGTQYVAGSSFSNLTTTNGGTVSRYAYTDATSYTVKYYLDGTEQTSLRQTCTYGAIYKYPSLPTKTGYTITGWWSGSSSSSKGTQYTAGGTFSNLSTANGGVVNRYAYSAPITYQVKFNGNGSTSGTMSNQSFTYDVAQNLTANAFKRAFTVTYNYNGNGASNTTTTANATFNGWANTSAGSKVYNDKQSVKNLSSTNGAIVNVYAKWTDTSVILPSPTRTGYTFSGWYTSSSGGTKVGSGGASYTPSANITLYAQWTPITYTVKYNGNTNTSGSTASSTHTYDVSKALTANSFTKTGYKFVNWNTKADGSGTTYTNQQSVKNLTTTNGATINLYAQWTPITYTISFNGNGSTSGSTASMSMTYDVAKNLTANGFSKTGYVFSGWNTKTDGSGTNYSDKQSVKNLSSTQGATITLYAKWTPITYTVKYNANSGTGTTASSSHTYDVAKNLTANNFTKTGYIFKSWNTKADGSGTSYTDKQSVKNLTTTNGAVINLYAQWTPITYTIRFDGNGSTSGSTASMSMTYDVAKALTANGFQKTDHTFTCWSIVKDGQGACYADKQSVKNMTTVNGGVVTLYAQWEEDRKLSLEAITPNAAYREGTEVITSFNIINEGTKDCIPSDNVSVVFKVYKDNTLIKTVTRNNVIVPGNEKNLLYFKWTVPENIGSSTMYVSGEIVENGSSYSLVKNAYETTKYVISSTPDTQYEIGAPSGFTVPSVTVESNNGVTWNEWTYSDGTFKKVKYGVGITSEGAVITPDASANATKENGKWVMKSGYGFGISVPNGVRALDGCTVPTTSAYTKAQYTTALFPEFSYLTTINKYRTLELSGSNWIFRDNDDYGKIHFTPLWYPDGSYTVSVVQSDMWTPAGMISRQVNTNTVTISGSAYDDWYI